MSWALSTQQEVWPLGSRRWAWPPRNPILGPTHLEVPAMFLEEAWEGAAGVGDTGQQRLLHPGVGGEGSPGEVGQVA